jgi:uncharacterized membrane protein HdeD (DUF308 family)
MLQLLLRKWWVLLVQGLILIILSIYIFNNPLDVLKGISLWIGILILITGLIGILSWVGGDQQKRENTFLLWSILTTLFGVFMLFNLFTTMKLITVIFGLWMLLTGLHLVQSGVELKKNHSFGWVMIIAGILSALVAIMIIFNIGTGATGISILIGLQVLLAGIALVIFSFAKKALVGHVKLKIKSIRNDFPLN